LYKSYRLPYIAIIVLLILLLASDKIFLSSSVPGNRGYKSLLATGPGLILSSIILFIECTLYYAFQTHIYSRKLALWHIGLLYLSLFILPYLLYFFRPSNVAPVPSEMVLYFKIYLAAMFFNVIITIAAHLLFLINMVQSWKLPPETEKENEGLLDKFQNELR